MADQICRVPTLQTLHALKLANQIVLVLNSRGTMAYFDLYGFKLEDDIEDIKSSIDEIASINLIHDFSDLTGEYYSLDIPGVGYDIFKLFYNEICDEDGCFLRFRDFPEHTIILSTWSKSLETINEYRGKLLSIDKIEFLRREDLTNVIQV